jgi:pyruvate/2-oxoglutarate/acetoin dehydrogenase E1 component
MKFVEAIRQALADEMAADSRVVLWGEDIGPFGGSNRVTLGLQERFGAERVRDAPLSEQAMLSIGIGAAMAGLRPVVEIMFAGLMPLVAEALANQAAKTRYRTGGQWTVPLVVRTRCGGRPGQAPVSAETYMEMFAGVPGLVVFAPGTVDSAYRQLRAAIRSEDPVVFFEHGGLYNTRGEVADGPLVDYTGEARVLRDGNDATVVAIMAMVPEALKAADMLSSEGIQIEVIDPCTIYPYDAKTVIDSVRKTGRLLVVQDAPIFGGLSSELLARAAELGVLRVPPARIGFPSIPFPVATHFGQAHLPSASTISAAIRSLVAERC